MLIIGQLRINLWIDTMMNIKTLSLCLVTLVYFDVSAAEKLTVYRWIDKENVVHFSQNQPDLDDYIEMSMAKNKKSSVSIDSTNTTESSQLKNREIGDSNEKSVISNDKCRTARENIKTLENFDKIKYEDEKGNVKVLGALEMEQQLAMNTKQAEVYCTN